MRMSPDGPVNDVLVRFGRLRNQALKGSTAPQGDVALPLDEKCERQSRVRRGFASTHQFIRQTRRAGLGGDTLCLVCAHGEIKANAGLVGCFQGGLEDGGKGGGAEAVFRPVGGRLWLLPVEVRKPVQLECQELESAGTAGSDILNVFRDNVVRNARIWEPISGSVVVGQQEDVSYQYRKCGR